MQHRDVILKRATAAYRAAWQCPRYAFRHGNGPIIPLQPTASAAIAAGGSRVPLGDVTAEVVNERSDIAIDGNVHQLVQLTRQKPVDIVIHEGLTSPHLDIEAFLAEIYIATGIESARVFVSINAAGPVDVAVAPSVAWVDPLVRRCADDYICVQQFLFKYKVAGVAPAMLERLFGAGTYGQFEGGTPDALAPFMARVRVVLGRQVVDARYFHTVSELLDALPPVPIYLNGVQLQRCSIALWKLSPCSHGVIHLYTDPARQVEERTIMGGRVRLPAGHRLPAFVPCDASFTGNAFAPELRHTAAELAALAPAVPTPLFLRQLVLGEPMTVSRAQCIYRHLSAHYPPQLLSEALLSLALPEQSDVMAHMLPSQHTMAAHSAFAAFVHQLTMSWSQPGAGGCVSGSGCP